MKLLIKVYETKRPRYTLRAKFLDGNRIRTINIGDIIDGQRVTELSTLDNLISTTDYETQLKTTYKMGELK